MRELRQPVHDKEGGRESHCELTVSTLASSRNLFPQKGQEGAVSARMQVHGGKKRCEQTYADGNVVLVQVIDKAMGTLHGRNARELL